MSSRSIITIMAVTVTFASVARRKPTLSPLNIEAPRTLSPSRLEDRIGAIRIPSLVPDSLSLKASLGGIYDLLDESTTIVDRAYSDLARSGSFDEEKVEIASISLRKASEMMTDPILRDLSLVVAEKGDMLKSDFYPDGFPSVLRSVSRDLKYIMFLIIQIYLKMGKVPAEYRESTVEGILFADLDECLNDFSLTNIRGSISDLKRKHSFSGLLNVVIEIEDAARVLRKRGFVSEAIKLDEAAESLFSGLSGTGGLISRKDYKWRVGMFELFQNAESSINQVEQVILKIGSRCSRKSD